MPDSLQRLERLTARLTGLREVVKDEYQFFWDNTGAILVVADKDYFIKANPAMLKILGYTEAEFLDIKWLELLHPEDQIRTRERADKLAIEKKVDDYYLIRFRKKDGTYALLRWKDAVFKNGYYWSCGEYLGDA